MISQKQQKYISHQFYEISIDEFSRNWIESIVVTKRLEIEPFESERIHRTNLTVSEKNVCLFYSSSPVQWQTELNKGILKGGSVVLFDHRESFELQSDTPFSTVCISISYQFYNATGLSDLFSIRGQFFSVFISEILRDIEQKDNIELKYKLLSLVYMLPVIHEKNKKLKEITLLDKIKRIIKTYALDSFFNLSKAAKMSFCSKRTLHNCLMKEGTTFTKLILKYRIEYLAEQLLVDRKSRVDAICYKSGFNSTSYAIKKFKSIKGVTPKQYRGNFYESS
ncbi:helix-turn-helix domain-containing protein [Aliivibrio fischeri]|uniref:helix-turn-helix domain-containing protein n=1 Tax=Aliivibrio fischeri TaxID=668 RepID=UPI0012D9E1F7|nr:helix-turn-helix transcriptional regulator [Aliivibrio fischeri]MUK25173.1 helix-turn-helix domain-containing protein [Aliivibrio fischeri]MUK32311.1 helix-turn-helix domain-containing protein [Aliivibrio fischeri]